MLKELRQKEIEALFDFQVKEAEDVCAAEKKEQLERMSLEIEDNLKRMKDLKDGVISEVRNSDVLEGGENLDT